MVPKQNSGNRLASALCVFTLHLLPLEMKDIVAAVTKSRFLGGSLGRCPLCNRAQPAIP